MKFTRFSLPLALALAAVVSASPAEAQKGRGHGNAQSHGQQDRTRDRDRDRDDDDYDRRDDRRGREEPRFERRRNVPAGWCQGRGNPHNTVENCGRGSDRYDSRSGSSTRNPSSRLPSTRYPSTDRRYENGTSYDQAHRDFHYSHDRQCQQRLAQNPGNLRWQVQVRSECKATHDAFHRQWGTSHR